MQKYRVSPTDMILCVWCNRKLILSLTKREVVGRYKGSIFGLLWSFLNPLFMLAVYTFAFGVVHQARWGGAENSTANFALVIFAGMIVFNLFSECVNRAPTLILRNANYVKKVIFPLEILPVVALCSALFHMLVSVMVWLIFHLLLFGVPNWTIILVPLVMLPLLLFTMGFSWMLTSLGVFLRDVGHVIGVFTTALLFLSAIFYPVEALPQRYRFVLMINPLVPVIEQTRQVMIFGNIPSLSLWFSLLAGGFMVAWLGFAWFQKTRKAFADVI